MSSVEMRSKLRYRRQALERGTVTQFIVPLSYEVQELSCDTNLKQLHFIEQTKQFNFQQEFDAEQKIAAQNTKDVEEGLHHLERAFLYKSRLDYLSFDTRKALFDRAQWFTLSGSQHALKLATYQGFDVLASKIQMVLFEFPDEVKTEAGDKPISSETDPKSKKFDHKLLQTGFLVVDVTLSVNWQTKTAPPVINDIISFNYHFRYLAPPYANYEYDKKNKLVSNFQNITDFINLKERFIEQGIDAIEAERAMRFAGHWLQFTLLPFKSEKSGKTFKVNTLEAVIDHCHQLGLLSQQRVTDKQHELIYPEHRAFLRTFVETPKGCGAMSLNSANNAHHSTQWAALLNVDLIPSQLQNTNDFEVEWLNERTYLRWQHFDTLYGFNYNSTAAILAPNSDPPLRRHYLENYLDITLLLFYARVSLFRFSHSLNEFTSEVIHSELTPNDEKHLKNLFDKLRLSFSAFLNLYKFPLISNQQQAIEMYTKQREIMDIDELFSEIDSEITNTHDFLQLKEASNHTEKTEALNKETAKLNKIVFWVGLLGVIATLFTISSPIDFFKSEPEKQSVSKQEGQQTEVTLVQPAELNCHAKKGSPEQLNCQVTLLYPTEKEANNNKVGSSAPINKNHSDKTPTTFKGFTLKLETMWLITLLLCFLTLTVMRKDICNYIKANDIRLGVIAALGFVFISSPYFAPPVAIVVLLILFCLWGAWKLCLTDLINSHQAREKSEQEKTKP